MLTETLVAHWQELLEGGDSAAVRVAAEDTDEATVVEAAQAHDRRVLVLDLQDSETESDILAAVADTFDIDRESELDWDMLDDALAEYEVAPQEGLLVVVSEWESLVEAREETLATIIDVLRTAARDWEDEDQPWLVLVAGDGPGFGLPWIGSGTAPWLRSHDDPAGFDDEAQTGMPDGDGSDLDIDLDDERGW